jgi:hypothetical protein
MKIKKSKKYKLYPHLCFSCQFYITIKLFTTIRNGQNKILFFPSWLPKQFSFYKCSECLDIFPAQWIQSSIWPNYFWKFNYPDIIRAIKVKPYWCFLLFLDICQKLNTLLPSQSIILSYTKSYLYSIYISNDQMLLRIYIMTFSN